MNGMIQKSKKNLKNKKGFTLIELIVVIVIIGILAAIVIPNLAGFRDSGAYKADIATAKTLATAAAAWYSDDPATRGTATGEDPTTDADFKALLPAGLTLPPKSQLDPSADLDVLVFDDGNVTVTSGTFKWYPVPDPMP